MSLQSPSPQSARKQLAAEKAKKAPFNVMPEKNPYAELLSTEADFLDDIEASIHGIEQALTKIKDQKERASLVETKEGLNQFLQKQEHVFQLMLNERSPKEWANAIYQMQDAYLQLLLILEKAKFSNVADQTFKDSVKEAGRVGQDIHSYLSKPMQRLQRYHLLINEIIKSMAPDKISEYNDFAQRGFKSLNVDYVQVHLRLKSIVERGNLLYGIVSAAQKFKESDKKQNIALLERIVNECLRKKDTGDYALSSEMIIITLKTYLTDPDFVKAFKQVITQKKSELEKTLFPVDESMQVLQYLSKEKFREQIPFREEKKILDEQEKVLRQEISFLYGKLESSDKSTTKHTEKEIKRKEAALGELTEKIGNLSQKIGELEKEQANYEERHRKMQEQKKEALREQHLPLRMDYHQLNLLQKDLEQMSESLLAQSAAPAKPPRPPRQLKH